MDNVLQDKVYAATEAVTETRLHQLGCKLISRQRCAHNSVDVAAEIQAARKAGAELILLCGCSAIADRQDILPMAIENAGGQIDQLGLAVDPGNMLLIGHIDSLPVIGMPGCARSPKLNGFDWVLHLLLSDIELSRDELADMAAGGLLMEIASRPLPRDLAVKPASPKAQMSAVVLAAGQSRRMGKINKLTAVVAGKPVIRHVVDTVLEAGLKDIVVVLGYDEQAVSACLEGLPVRFVKNEAFRSGQASSVSAGIAALDNNVSDVMVVLGDMPLLSAALLNNLHHHHMRNPQHEQMISLPVCLKDRERQVGHPVIWGRQFFPDLQALTGDQGGRQIWSDHPAIINQMDVEDATLFLDTDTAEALRRAEVLLLARN
jgi:molybdenum cofactor cytidylyltransferase